nr:5'-nucleotidase SurE-like isoform X4 [Ipomoea batatas]GMD72561.1 5'-nucleotidase SurE-like isoform X4 [Ipomoea batatas]GME10864.1 5'-nucleotidase SurE-like isoform X4 [Ipomoea batatas]GME10876.1 5'-nucleotidase SurE-like isoform X4 [Ipomoea batatas]
MLNLYRAEDNDNVITCDSLFCYTKDLFNETCFYDRTCFAIFSGKSQLLVIALHGVMLSLLSEWILVVQQPLRLVELQLIALPWESLKLFSLQFLIWLSVVLIWAAIVAITLYTRGQLLVPERLSSTTFLLFLYHMTGLVERAMLMTSH